MFTAKQTIYKIIATVLFIISFFQLVSGQEFPFLKHNFEGTAIEGSSAVSMTEDKNGFLWMGIYGKGIVRYDGKNTEIFNKNIPEGCLIQKIWQDQLGYIWFGARTTTKEKAGLFVSNRPVGIDMISDSIFFVKTHFDVELATNGPRAFNIKFNASGDFLVEENHNLIHYYYSDDLTFSADTIVSTPDSIKSSFIRSACFLNEVDFVTLGYRGSIIRHIYSKEGIYTTDSTMVKGTVPGRLYFTDSLGGIWGGNTEKLFYINPENELTEYFVSGGALGAYPFGNNKILGIGNNGVFEVQLNPKFTHRLVGPEEGLDILRIFSIQNSKDNVWITAEGGFYSLERDYAALKTYNSKSKIKLADDRITSVNKGVLLNEKDSILIASTNKGINLINEKTSENEIINIAKGLSSNAIYAVSIDNKKRLWITSKASGLIDCIYPLDVKPEMVVEKSSINLFGSNYGIGFWKSPIWGMQKYFNFPSSDSNKSCVGAAIGSIYSTVCIIVDDQKVIVLDKKNNFKNNGLVNEVCQDKEGYLYVTSTYGLHQTTFPWTTEKYEEIKDSFHNYNASINAITSSDSLFHRIPLIWKKDTILQMNSILEVDDNIWISTSEGIYILSKESHELTHKIDQGGAYCLTAHDGNIWAGSNGGLMKFDKDKYSFLGYIKEEDGLIDNANSSQSRSLFSDGNNLYYGTFGGLIKFDPSKYTPNNDSLKCYVRNLKVEQNLYGDNKVTISFIGLNSLKQKTILYKTRLKGLDSVWSDSTEISSVEYMNLKAFFFPKKYQFEFKALDYQGNWHSLSSDVAININPPIWLRWWAFLLYAFLIYLLIRWLLKKQEENIRNSLLLEEAAIIKEKNVIISEKIAQNELLIKEIHHRVKNNLQTISSLLYLQSASIDDVDAKSSLKAIQQRVESMALIHKKLYEENDLSRIGMQGYIELLVKNLIDSFGYKPDEIEGIYDIDPIKMELDIAIPLGLLVTELVTNSLKYAFPEKRDGVITVSLKKIREGKMQLSVSDNGVGKNISVIESFGTKLIKLLSQQIEGELTSGNGPGYWTAIVFSVENQLSRSEQFQS